MVGFKDNGVRALKSYLEDLDVTLNIVPGSLHPDWVIKPPGLIVAHTYLPTFDRYALTGVYTRYLNDVLSFKHSLHLLSVRDLSAQVKLLELVK